ELLQRIMSRTCKAVAADSAVILPVIAATSGTGESDDEIPGANQVVSDQLLFRPPGCHCAIYRNTSYHITYIGSFSAQVMDVYSETSHLFEKLVGGFDDHRKHFTGNDPLVAVDSRRKQNVVSDSRAKEVIEVHDDRILCNSLPHGNVAGFFPIEICKNT